MSEDVKAKVQHQFGRSSAAYATSDVHAKGESLSVLEELIPSQPGWAAMDVATGAGHTALLFASKVARVVATDLTQEMLDQTAAAARKRGLTNVETRFADAEALPFGDAEFDLVTCRLALHHFPDAAKAASEFARVLKPGGYVGFTDNFTVEEPAAAAVYNAYEKLRDPSHVRVRSLPELTALFEGAGLRVEAVRRLTKEFEFQEWADRQRVSAADKSRLLDMMRSIPAALTPLFAPRWADGTMYFSLWEAVIAARKPQ